MRRLSALVLAVLIAGCAGQTDSATSTTVASVAPPTSAVQRQAADVARVPEVLTAAGPFRISRSMVTRKDNGPEEQDIGYEGHADLKADEGSLRLDLAVIVEMLNDPRAGGGNEEAAGALSTVSASWRGKEFWLQSNGRSEKLDRNSNTGGMIGQAPEMPRVDLELLTKATAVQQRGDEVIDGRPTTHFVFALAPETSINRYDAGEVWLDAAGAPARIIYTRSAAASPNSSGRTINTTIAISEVGKPFTVDLPR